MDIKLEHVSIIDKKFSPFVRAVIEIFKSFFGKVTFAPPCAMEEVSNLGMEGWFF
jgi:hypothetical protein